MGVRLAVKLSVGQFSTLSRGELQFLVNAWEWLRANEYPRSAMEDSMYLFARTYDDEIVGVLEFRIEDSYVWIQVLYVDHKYLRQGVGRELLRHILSQFPEKNIGLGTREWNESMRGLAKMSGMKERPRVIEYWRD